MSESDKLQPFFDRLADLYARMDAAYNATAGRYGFDCADCADNCCYTVFYNHTSIEYFYLMEGLARLSEEKRRAVVAKALDARNQVDAAKAAGQKPRVLCPLNENGLCAMHGHRLMICRLHGIPYEIHYPGRTPFKGSGCEVFETRCTGTAYLPFDRTPFYSELAQLEQAVRQATGRNEKVKMTIAQMLSTDLPADLSHAGGAR
ncbi:hypothetical protein [Desulfosudis oleivorans]|uniref:YkgJ family cysteine cluster protein n=1 Tax=Desulfosudis oleivorans (strain DSM 6200 / JCM 39069 / Hxd3) TaxID=96561 RepID=A8ZTI4_DESOH|nr:hypothetical protein [Desulfosudis oleivorans]ABW66248.1 conserved hypothetical protein [Desulfosudis oleivorans Hxd3]